MRSKAERAQHERPGTIFMSVFIRGAVGVRLTDSRRNRAILPGLMLQQTLAAPYAPAPMRLPSLALVLFLVAGCGSESSSPTSPSVQTTSLSGIVTIAPSGVRASGATVTIVDGANAGRSATTDGTGSYRIEGLTPANGNVSARGGTGFVEDNKGLFITGAATLNFTITAPLFAKNGGGTTVFDMPTWVTRVRIVGTSSSRCDNFIVHIAGRLIVNEILGTCSVAIGLRWDATYLTTGGVVETNASGINWTFTEVR